VHSAPDDLPAKPRKAPLRRLVDATGYSLAGLRTAWRGEAAFRLEVGLCVVLLPLGLWLGGNGVERALLAGSLFLVLIAELVNSAVEAVVDRFGAARHPLSGNAKDLGSAAVGVALCAAALTWLLVLAG
jgi:diacylglycerol kinase (ATP)